MLVRSDLRPGLEAIAVRARIDGSEFVTSLDPDAPLLETGVQVASLGVPPGAHEVFVELVTPQTSLVRTTIAAVDDLPVVITVGLYRSCLGVACNADDELCFNGECINETCLEDPSLCDGPVGCSGDDSCTESGGECADTRCVARTCVRMTFDDRCDDGTYCSSGGTCEPIPAPPPLLDAGIDAGNPDTGTSSDAEPLDGELQDTTDGPGDTGADSDSGDAELSDSTVPWTTTDLAVGNDVVCLARAGRVQCSGAGLVVGDGQTGAARIGDVADVRDALEVGCGQGFCCVLHQDGRVSCWGGNRFGQLGYPGGESSPYRIQVEGLPPATALDAAVSHACVISGADVWCWGDNSSLQLGPMRPNPFRPEVIADLPAGPAAVRCSRATTCVRLVTGAATCWGTNSAGQLGIPWATTESATPVTPENVADLVRLDGQWDQFFALTSTGEVVRWGQVASPRSVFAAGTGFVDVRVGVGHQCALNATGSVSCWGNNESLQLGMPGASRPEALEVPGLTGITQLESGHDMSCALNTAGNVWCWGSNRSGVIRSDSPDVPQLPTRLDFSF